MAKVNLSKAAILVSKNRTTIWRHVNSGKLSIERDRDGNPMVDTSELIRVYGELRPEATPKKKNIQQQAKEKLEALIEEVNSMRATQEELIAEIADLKFRLTHTPSKPEVQEPLPRPEDDPEWPKEIRTTEDIIKRNEIKNRYSSKK